MEQRVPVTVGVVTGDDRRATREFLTTLATQLRTADNVLLLGPAGPASPDAWRVLSGRGELRRPDPAALPRLRETAVLVEDRVTGSDGWLDRLVRSLSAPEVGAAAPRTNVADGDELYLGVPYRPGEPNARRAFSRRLATSESGLVTSAEVLDGPCLALRRSALAAAGGFEEALAGGYDPAGLSEAVAAAGLRLVIAESVYLHHPGGSSRRPDPARRGRPLVSACLIVKDEEANLPRCLESAAGVADEIVVYDTGSTDSTVELAKAAGATVHPGYWDDDFSRARNEALGHCRGQWILWLDADETLVTADPAALREQLASESSDVEGYLVLIDNLRSTDASTSFTHPATRLFRRAYGHWEGKLHELVLARAGAPDLTLPILEGTRISHRGYLAATIQGRGKSGRNLRSAFADLAGSSDLPAPLRLYNLGRSYLMAGLYEEGLELCRQVVERPNNPVTLRLALRSLADACLVLGRPKEALEAAEQLRQASTVGVLADVIEGQSRLDLGEPEAALAAFERVRPVVDDDGFEYSPHEIAPGRAAALRALGRPGEAADVLLACLRETGGVDVHLGALIETLDAAGRDLGEIYDSMSADRRLAFLPQLLQLQAEPADRTLEAWHGRDPSSLPVLATAAKLAPSLDVSRQLVWSARLRAAGQGLSCPLVASSAEPGVPARDRVLAAAAASALFEDARATHAFGPAVLALEPDLREQVRAEVAAIAPARLEHFDALGSFVREAGTVGGCRTSELGDRVLVLGRDALALRSFALAAGLAANGHAVTLAHGGSPRASEALLAPLGVAVATWPEPFEPERWSSAAAALLARLSAADRFDVVVFDASTADLVAVARRQLPLAGLVADRDGGPGAGSHAEPDARLDGAPDEPAGWTDRPPARAFEAAVPRLFPSGPRPPLAARRGVCVVGPVPPSDLESGAALDALRPVLEQVTVAAVEASRPGGSRLAELLPTAAIRVPLCDPGPWLASARLALVPPGRGARAWLEAAAACGTPGVLLTGSAEQVRARVTALLGDERAWTEALAAAPVQGRSSPDPLGLPGRRTNAGAVDERRRPRAPGEQVGARPEVRIVGKVWALDSLAQMNRSLAEHLARREPGLELSVAPSDAPPAPGPRAPVSSTLRDVRVARAGDRPPAVEIRQQWPPDFTPSSAERLVIFQPWEFGGLPLEWIGPLRDVADELWVPTTWVRDCAVASGVAPERVQVVPYGIDAERYRPEGERYALRTSKRTKLLFVGGCIPRKGVDALLEVYLSNFSPTDDVCLVVKPFGSASVYSNSTLEPALREAATSGAAEIEIVEGDLSDREMAALYRSCDVLVHPYRGEGFGLPIAQALASGLPVVATEGGAADDFYDAEVGWPVPSRRLAIGMSEWTPSAAGTWWLEPSRAGLAAALRAALADPEEARRRGRAGRERIAARFSWDAAADVAAARIAALLEGRLAVAGAGAPAA